MRTVDFSRIAASAPLNRTAASVTSESRDCYVSKAKMGSAHFGEPPRMREPTSLEKINVQWTDLRGRKFGHFTVLGIFVPRQPGKLAVQLWVVRCVCGDYETRRSKAILNPENNRDRCGHCRQTEYLRNLESKKAHGIIPKVTVEEFVADVLRKP